MRARFLGAGGADGGGLFGRYSRRLQRYTYPPSEPISTFYLNRKSPTYRLDSSVVGTSVIHLRLRLLMIIRYLPTQPLLRALWEGRRECMCARFLGAGRVGVGGLFGGGVGRERGRRRDVVPVKLCRRNECRSLFEPSW
jgi:hypothetical protein